MKNRYQAIAAGRKLPMEAIGTTIPEQLTADEALQVAGLDWQVDHLPLFTLPLIKQETTLDALGNPVTQRVAISDEQVRPVVSETSVAIVRDSDQSILGIVGKGSYHSIQNREAFGLLDGLREEGNANIDLAFQARGGAIVGMNARFPKTIMVGGVDPVDVNLLVVNSHDGSRAFTAAVTPVRLECMNMLNYAIKNAHQSWKIRHTASAMNRVAEARRSLELTFKYVESFEERAERLINTNFSVDQFRQLASTLYPSKEDDDNAARTQSALLSNFLHTSTIDDSFRNTRWGALQAVTEYLDWQRPRRNSKVRNSTEIWAESLMFGQVQEIKTNLGQLLDA